MAEANSGTGAWGPLAESPSVRALRGALAEGRCPHALLISGPEGIGKRRLALMLARGLVCEREPAERPCLDCRACERVGRRLHADVELVEPGGLCDVSDHDHPRSADIRICQVRRLERICSLTPFESPTRTIIIDPADRITGEASDAFLKTLEEPPAGVHFILLTAREARLSETVRSRCRALSLSPPGAAAAADWLSEHGAERYPQPEQRLELANISRGRLGWLEQALADGDPLEVRGSQIDQLRALSTAPAAERLSTAEQLGGRGPGGAAALRDIDFLLSAWADWLRDLWLASAGLPERAMHCWRLDDVRKDAARYSEEDICAFLRTLQETRELLRRGANPRLALEVLLLRLPRPSETPAA